MKKRNLYCILALGTLILSSCNSNIQQNSGVLQVFLTKIPYNNEIYIGENFQLEADVLNYKEDNSVYFESLNPAICSVSTNGVIEGVSVGQTTIYAVSNEDETKNAGVNITVKEALHGENIVVSLSETNVSLKEGESRQLVATVENFTETSEVTREVDDPTICDLYNGVITGYKAGNTIVRAKSVENPDKFAICNVEVIEGDDDVFVTINTPSKTRINIGETLTLTATVSNSENQNVTWSSSNSGIISIDNNGVITGVSVGEANITATSVADNTKSYSLRFNCIDSVHGYELVWVDNFDGTSLNENYWNYQEGDGSQYGIPGWGNGEAQYYRRENVTVSDGTLKITLKSESYGGKEYTSARIRTNGKVAMTYGRIEARIKMPAVEGAWPAFWMLPDTDTYGGWPNSGEIDIMEVRGRLPYETTSALHYALETGAHYYETDKAYFQGSDSITDFHIYAVEWDDDQFRFYLDEYCLMTINSWSITGQNYSTDAPFDKDFHILLNMACGGHFDEYRNPKAEDLPAVMEVDYVKWYQK